MEVTVVFDGATIEFLQSGCAVLIGTADETCRPHAGRGWGLTVLELEPTRLRLLVDADDTRTLANARPGALIAITASNVRTLNALQLKGRVLRTEPATPADAAKLAQYINDFLHDIHETDGDPVDVLQRWALRSVVACVVEVGESFDQTPGPAAGAPIAGPRQ